MAEPASQYLVASLACCKSHGAATSYSYDTLYRTTSYYSLARARYRDQFINSVSAMIRRVRAAGAAASALLLLAAVLSFLVLPVAVVGGGAAAAATTSEGEEKAPQGKLTGEIVSCSG